MRKQTLFNALTLLKINNLLYQTIIINYDILSSIPENFISEDISSKVVIIKNNRVECKGYRANLAENNRKNNLNHCIRSVGINESGILYKCQ